MSQAIPALAESVTVNLDVHGFRVALRGWSEVVDEVARDFAWFASGSAPGPVGVPDAEVVAEEVEPDYSRFGPLPAAFVTPRNVVHQHGDLTVVDYFGRALSVLDRRNRRIVVQGRDPHLVHEAIYHFILSQASAALEARGLVRLHSLGLVGRDGAVAVMLPSGGGKSTLALSALAEPGVRLLSEDSPLMDGRGRLHPFPLRIGVNPSDADLLPPGPTRRLERMEFHPKIALDLDAFNGRIARAPAAFRHLVIARRTLGSAAAIERIPRRHALGPLLREAVVGVGLYQGMEFVLQRGMRDVANQARPVAIRASRCAAMLRRASVWRLTLGRDRARNWDALRPLLG